MRWSVVVLSLAAVVMVAGCDSATTDESSETAQDVGPLEALDIEYKNLADIDELIQSVPILPRPGDELTAVDRQQLFESDVRVRDLLESSLEVAARIEGQLAKEPTTDREAGIHKRYMDQIDDFRIRHAKIQKLLEVFNERIERWESGESD